MTEYEVYKRQLKELKEANSRLIKERKSLESKTNFIKHIRSIEALDDQIAENELFILEIQDSLNDY